MSDEGRFSQASADEIGGYTLERNEIKVYQDGQLSRIH